MVDESNEEETSGLAGGLLGPKTQFLNLDLTMSDPIKGSAQPTAKTTDKASTH